MGPLTPFLIEWSLAINKSQRVNGEIYGCVSFSSEIKIKNLKFPRLNIAIGPVKQRNLSVKLFKHLFWVLKRTASLRPFFLAPITYVLVEKYEN